MIVAEFCSWEEAIIFVRYSSLGLGYPEGPIELLARTGLAEHYDVTSALYFALGQESYAPARRAHVSKQRHKGII